jgi:hypothetical protein
LILQQEDDPLLEVFSNPYKTKLLKNIISNQKVRKSCSSFSHGNETTGRPMALREQQAQVLVQVQGGRHRCRNCREVVVMGVEASRAGAGSRNRAAGEGNQAGASAQAGLSATRR